jgi:hypothetical protein
VVRTEPRESQKTKPGIPPPVLFSGTDCLSQPRIASQVLQLVRNRVVVREQSRR